MTLKTVNFREEHPANEMYKYPVKEKKKCMQVQAVSLVSRIMQIQLVFNQLALHIGRE